MPKPLRPTWSGALQVTGTGPFKKVKQKWPVEVYSWEDLLEQVIKKCTPFVPDFKDRVYVRNTDADKDAVMMDHAVFSFSYFNKEFNENQHFGPDDYAELLARQHGKLLIEDMNWNAQQILLRGQKTRLTNLPPQVKITINESWTGNHVRRHDLANEVVQRFRQKQLDDYKTNQTGDQFMLRHMPREKKFSLWWWIQCFIDTFLPCCCWHVGTINAHIYAHTGDYEQVQRSIMDGNDINERDRDGRTVLSIAFMRERGDMINLLLDNGADPNLRDVKTGFSPMHHCCAQKYNSGLEKLLEWSDKDKGIVALLNIRDNEGATPLMIACANAYIDGIIKIVGECNFPDAFGREYDEVEDKKDNNGWTPLHYAAAKGNLEIVQYLVEEVEVNIHKLDKHRLNAAELALKAGHGEVTSYLNYKNPHVFDPYDPRNVDLLRG